MLEAQDFSLRNPHEIEKLKLVNGSEVCCVTTIKGKGATIIAYGVDAVRVYDRLVAARN